MLTPVGRPSIAIVTPLLKANDTGAAGDNWTFLNNAIQTAQSFSVPLTIQLPVGLFYVGGAATALFRFDELTAGLTIRGMGPSNTILVPYSTSSITPFKLESTRVSYSSNGTPNGSALRIDGIPANELNNYQRHELVYIWALNSGNTRSVSYRRRIDNVDTANLRLDLDSSFPAGTFLFKHVKGLAIEGPIPAGSTTVTLEDPTLSNRLTVGGDVLIGDGPALNNFYSEWARIAAITGSDPVAVTLDRRLRRVYAPTGSNRGACIVPGPHLADITIRDLTILPDNVTPSNGFGLVRFGVRVRLHNVELRPATGSTGIVAGPIQMVNCGNSAVEGIDSPATLKVIAAQDIHVRDCQVGGVIGSEYCSDCLFDGLTTFRADGFQFASASGPGPCLRVHLVNSRITNHGETSHPNVNFVEGSVIENVQIVQPGTSGSPTPAIVLEDDNLTLNAVVADLLLLVRGTDWRIGNLTAYGGLKLDVNSSGILLAPVLPASPGVDELSPVGAWRRPLRAYIDGRVAAEDVDQVALIVAGRDGQNADLTQWQSDGGTRFYGIRADGELATSRALDANGVSNLTAVVSLFDIDNPSTVIGYIPVYQNFTSSG